MWLYGTSNHERGEESGPMRTTARAPGSFSLLLGTPHTQFSADKSQVLRMKRRRKIYIVEVSARYRSAYRSRECKESRKRQSIAHHCSCC